MRHYFDCFRVFFNFSSLSLPFKSVVIKEHGHSNLFLDMSRPLNNFTVKNILTFHMQIEIFGIMIELILLMLLQLLVISRLGGSTVNVSRKEKTKLKYHWVLNQIYVMIVIILYLLFYNTIFRSLKHPLLAFPKEGVLLNLLSSQMTSLSHHL